MVLDAQWLVETEKRFGGLVRNVKRRVFSFAEPDALRNMPMTGGDRMNPDNNDYAPAYAKHLSKFDRLGKHTIIELGILRGTGLATWVELFPYARVIGLDLDLEPFKAFLPELLKAGAFSTGLPETYQFDQTIADDGRLERIVDGRGIDIMIDDALHTREAVLRTYHQARPLMLPGSVYFAEDCRTVTKDFIRLEGAENVSSYAESNKLTVIEL